MELPSGVTNLRSHPCYVGAHGVPLGHFTGNFDGPGELGETCFGAAFDNAGNLYCANLDRSLTFCPAGDVVHGKILIANMGFVPFGLAIDKTRGFIYVSNGIGNSIGVYSTTGTLLDTIKN